MRPATADIQSQRAPPHHVRHRGAATPTQVMLAALVRAPFPTIPVIGARTPGQVQSSFASLKIEMSQAEAAALLASALGKETAR